MNSVTGGARCLIVTDAEIYDDKPYFEPDSIELSFEGERKILEELPIMPLKTLNLNLSAMSEQVSDDKEISEIETETKLELIKIPYKKPSPVRVHITPDLVHSDNKDSTIIDTRRESLPII